MPQRWLPPEPHMRVRALLVIPQRLPLADPFPVLAMLRTKHSPGPPVLPCLPPVLMRVPPVRTPVSREIRVRQEFLLEQGSPVRELFPALAGRRVRQAAVRGAVPSNSKPAPPRTHC